MAFSCLHENTEVKSFTYSQAGWRELADRFDGMCMTMPCCDQPAIMFTDSYGGQYFIHDEPIDGIASPCMESSSLFPDELYAKFVISKTLHDLGWHVDAEPIIVNGAKNELQTGIYARKGDNKNVVEVLSTQERLAAIKEKSDVHKLAGFKCVWFDLTNRSYRDSHYGIHADRNLLLFELILSKGEIFRVSDVYLPAETEDEPSFFAEVAKPIEVTLTIKDFFEQLMARNISWLARDDGNHYLTVGVGKKACYKCDMTITTVKRVFYHEQVYGVWHNESVIGHSIREIPRSDITVINEHFAEKHGFNPLKDVHSKTEGGEYMANSCKHCGGLVGKFFEDEEFYDMKCRNWESVSDRVVSAKPHKGHLNNEPGRWILNIDPNAAVSYMPFTEVASDYDDEDYIDCYKNDGGLTLIASKDEPIDVSGFWMTDLASRISNELIISTNTDPKE